MTDRRQLRQLQQLFLQLADQLPRAQVQNRLMATTDRDFGLSLADMDEADQDRILQLVSQTKAERVRQEIRLQRTRHVETTHSAVALETIIRSLETNRSVAGQRSYFRPRRPRSDG